MRVLQRFALALVLLAAGIAIYWNGLGAPFVYDDRFAIEENASIRALDAGALQAEPQLPTAGRPVVNLSLAINYAIGGLSVRGYRAFNLAVHLSCALLLWSLARRILQSPVLSGRFHARARELSGGNQQRLVVGRELSADVDLVVADDPARGLDLRATQFVYDQLRDAAARGAGVVIHSSDLDELLDVATRMVVVFHAIVTEVPMNRELVGRAMLGGSIA